MAQQTIEAATKAETDPETTGDSENPTAIARAIFDCCVGRHSQTLRDAGGTITQTCTTPVKIFDVLVTAEFAETPRVVHSKSLAQYGIEELSFWGIETTDDGKQVTTFSAEYEGEMYGLEIVVSGNDGSNGEEN